MAIITGNTCLQLGLPGRDFPPNGGGGAITATGHMPEPEVGYYIAPGTGGHGRARADGLLAVTQAFVCRVGVFGYDATRHDKFLIMVAARPVLDALDVLLPSIALRMETAARTAARVYGREVRSALPDMPDGRRCRALKAPYFRDYLRGFGQGVAETIREIRAEFITDHGADVVSILAEQDIRAEEVYSREFPDMAELRKERASHTEGFLAGQDAGRTADLGDEYLAQPGVRSALIHYVGEAPGRISCSGAFGLPAYGRTAGEPA
jgi:hypothetical protein